MSPEAGVEFRGFSDKEVRRNFVKRVYIILTVLLMITAAIIYPFLYVDAVQEFALDYWFLMFIPFIVYIVLLITLVCYERIRHIYPLNFILLFILTISMGLVCGFTTAKYSTEIVLITFGMTSLICVLVTLAACCLPIDITGWGGILAILSIGLLIFSLISMMLALLFQFKVLTLICAGCAVVLFSLYLLFDTQQIMGGKRVELSAEEYVLGALQLYVDIIYIFLNLLILVYACFGDN